MSNVCLILFRWTGEFEMQLTRYTDYGVRILTYLALLPEGRRASVSEISKVYDISRNHVNKIVHQLAKSGIIDTHRGRGGGFLLNQDPESIKLGDVVRLLENSLQIIDCETPLCRIAPACRLQSILSEATNAFLNTLDRYTLADLVGKTRSELTQILALG